MAKLVTPFDQAFYSPIRELYGTHKGTFTQLGGMNYNSALVGNRSGTKPITPFDQASYSGLIDKAGTNATTTDMRGSAAIGTMAWGPLEYNTGLAFVNSPKFYSPYDLAIYGWLLLQRQGVAIPASLNPPATDMRGSAAQSGTWTRLNDGNISSTTDMRGTTILETIREMGPFEYDASLVSVSTGTGGGGGTTIINNAHIIGGGF